MQKSIHYTYIALLTLTLSVAAIGGFTLSKFIIIVVALLSLIKFWLVAFQFMELKHAHSFWKGLILTFGLIIGASFIILL